MPIYAFTRCNLAYNNDPQMIQWDDIRVFLALTSAGTQKAAAKHLGIDQATVGRRIKEFESSLGTKLFDKRSDGFVLTAAGSEMFQRAKEAESLILEMERGAAALDQRPQGTIKIAMPGGMANHWLIPNLKPFLEKYPDIRIEFLTGPEVVNLWKRESDVAIRLVEPTQKDLFYKKLGEVRLKVYCSKDFLKNHKGEEQESWPFIGLFDKATSESERTLLSKLGPISRVTCRSHAWSSVYYGVKAGIGFGILPSFFAENDRELVEVPNTPSTKTAVWLVMHPDVKGTGRIRAFSDFVSNLMKR